MPWTGIAAGALSLLGGLGSYFLNKDSNDTQNQRNFEQWMRENNYNMPVNQVSRLRSAGLNPALMYQNGASGLISANSPEMQGNGQVDPMTASAIALNAAQAEKLKTESDVLKAKQPFEVRNLESQTKLNEASSLLNGALTEKAQHETSILAKDLEVKMRTLEDIVKQCKETARKAEADATISTETAKNISQALDDAHRLVERQIQAYDDEKNYKEGVLHNQSVANAIASRANEIRSFEVMSNYTLGTMNAWTARMEVLQSLKESAKRIESLQIDIDTATYGLDIKKNGSMVWRLLEEIQAGIDQIPLIGGMLFGTTKAPLQKLLR